MFEKRKKNLRHLEQSILKFEEGPVVKGKILFYGDSGFTRWKAEKYGNPILEDVIRMKDGTQAVVNHGFGSSTAEEQLYYYPRAVRPWEPRALVQMSFGNDIDYAYSPAEILSLETRILDYARADFPEIKLFICNVRPSINMLLEPVYKMRMVREFNELVAGYCAKHPEVTLVDHYACPYLFEEGRTGDPEGIRRDFFVEDNVHYNALGYEAYRKLFAEVLKDLL